MTSEAADDRLQSFDSNAMPWGELYIDQLKLGVPLKAFVSDPDTGMSVQIIRYAAGFTNPWHRHNCAHGIYVLEGTLKTHAGTFGPGNFVWFPEGMLMEHGATESTTPSRTSRTARPARPRRRGWPAPRRGGLSGERAAGHQGQLSSSR